MLKRQQELKFARFPVPAPPRAPKCCLSRAVSHKLGLQRGALLEEGGGRREKGKVDGGGDARKRERGEIFVSDLVQDAIITATAHLFPHSQSVSHVLCKHDNHSACITSNKGLS